MKICPLTKKPCNKTRLYHITEVKNGRSTQTFDVCEECFHIYAEKHSLLSNSTQSQVSNMNQVAQGVTEFLEKLMQVITGSPSPKSSDTQEQQICPVCGISLNDIYKQGKFGCDQCYKVFSTDLVLQRLHGATKHVGKVPKSWKEKQKQQKIKDYLANLSQIEILLNKRLQDSLSLEDYETASQVSQKIANCNVIRELESRLKDAPTEESQEIQQKMSDICESLLSYIEIV